MNRLLPGLVLVISLTILVLGLVSLGIFFNGSSPESSQPEVDIADPYIVGADWNNMSLTQKESWVDAALDAMMMGGELTESEKQSTIYYIEKLDNVFYDPANETKLVAWELTAFTSSPVTEAEDNWVLMDSGVSEYHLRGIWGTSFSDVFAVGGAGTIVHFDGNTWKTMESGTTNTLRGIRMSTSGLIAGGWEGTVVIYKQGIWEPIDGCTEHTIYGVGGTPNETYMVGSVKDIVYYDGYCCKLIDTGATHHLYSVWGSSSTDIFIVGAVGTILHYDGNSWKTMESGTTNPIHGVWGTSPTNVYAVGSQGLIIHYNGQSWQAMESNTSVTLRDVWGRSPNDVYIVGHEGTVLHYDGNDWIPMISAKEAVSSLPIDNQALWTLYGDDSDIFVVGNYGTILYSGEHQVTPRPPDVPTEVPPIVGGLEAEEYTDLDHGYTILYPKGWTIEESPDNTLEICKSDACIYVDPTYYSCDPLSEYVAQMREIHEENMGYEILTRGEIIVGDSFDACVDSMTSGDALVKYGIVTMEMHMYIKAKPCGLATRVITKCLQGNWYYYKDIFVDVTGSFRLLD